MLISCSLQPIKFTKKHNRNYIDYVIFLSFTDFFPGIVTLLFSHFEQVKIFYVIMK